MIEVDDGEGKVTVKKNVIVHTPTGDDSTIEVNEDLDYPAAGGHPVVIDGNTFTSDSATAKTAFVRVARPDVTVHNNTFTLTKPADGAAAVLVASPDPKKGVPVKNVKITFNRFEGGTAVANHEGIPLGAGAVTITSNDFSKAAKVLPKGKGGTDPLATVSPKEAIDATKNFWGSLKTDDVVGDTANPLTAYTPPKDDDNKSPGNPGAPGGPSAPGTQAPR